MAKRKIIKGTGSKINLVARMTESSRSKNYSLSRNLTSQGNVTYLIMAVDTADSRPKPSSNDILLEQEFSELAERWHKETRLMSSVSKMAMHPAYQGIIALGRSVIPLILQDLKKTRDHWLWALYVLNRFNDPAPPDATFDEAVDAWLAWGKEEGHLS